MNRELLSLLRCPTTGSELHLRAADPRSSDVESGELVSADGTQVYPIIDGVPRFVPRSNYAGSFGFQWNRFKSTQLDSHSGLRISHDRFYRYTGWKPADLAGKRVLDVGCGAGRFTEIALQTGANVVAIDYSSAVDACRANHRAHPNLDVLQADIYALPFAPGSFDFVYCLGVLQHTPNVHDAFTALPRQLRSGGELAVDLYPRLWRNILWSKYWLRPITKRMDAQVLFRAIERAVPVLLPLSRSINAIPALGPKLRYAVPVANYEGVYPLSESQLREWAILDTFDMLSPAHDHPQSASTLRAWFDEAGLHDVSVQRMGFLVGRGSKP